MNDVTIGKDNSRHSFVFTGKGGEYFLICLVNFLLTIITLGIYGPWALVKCHRYIYQHVTLKGQSFSYKGTGGAIFIPYGGLFSKCFLFFKSTLCAGGTPVCALDLRYSMYGSKESAVSGEHDLTKWHSLWL